MTTDMGSCWLMGRPLIWAWHVYVPASSLLTFSIWSVLSGSWRTRFPAEVIARKTEVRRDWKKQTEQQRNAGEPESDGIQEKADTNSGWIPLFSGVTAAEHRNDMAEFILLHHTGNTLFSKRNAEYLIFFIFQGHHLMPKNTYYTTSSSD